MSTPTFYELLGYLASVLVAVSLTMRRLVPLRVVNLLGAVLFTAYGLLIDAPPVWGVNAFIVVVNLWHLRHLRRALPRRPEPEIAAPTPAAEAGQGLAEALAAGRPLVLSAGAAVVTRSPSEVTLRRTDAGWSLTF